MIEIVIVLIVVLSLIFVTVDYYIDEKYGKKR